MNVRSCPMVLLGVVLFVLMGCLCKAEADAGPAAGQGSDRIRPYADNPRYWQYRGKPVLLIGGSREDNLFQIPDLEEQLDLLAEVGGNYIRNTMSSRDEGDVWPFHRREDGKYDLERLDDAHFGRMETLLRLAVERGVIVQIELWDRFDFAREPWLANPYRPANNVNYTADASGLKNAYPRHPGSNSNPFFRSVPALEDNKPLLEYQQAQVDRLLAISLPFPNVLYCMDNETSAQPAWGAYWSAHIKQKAAEAGVDVYTTEMWDAWDLRNAEHRHTFDHPECYAFVDTSQNNHNSGQKHWDNFQWVRQYVATQPRPLNHVKIYGADAGPFGTGRDGVERFWRSLIGGAASIRFHRPPSGLGLGATAQANLRSARLLVSAFDLFNAAPDAEGERLADAAENEAYVSCVPGKQYAVYFPDGGAVGLDLGDAAGPCALQWLDVAHSRWQDAPALTGGAQVELKTPGPDQCVALVTRR